MTGATELDPAATADRETIASPTLTWGDITRRVLATLLPMVALGAAVHLTVDVEYLIGWFPACLLLSLILMYALVPTRLGWAFLFAVVPSFGTIACAALIAAYRWSPPEAQTPISSLWWAVTLLTLALGIPANASVWGYRAAAQEKRPFRWQFPIRLLLVLMLFLSLSLTLGKLFLPNRGDFMIFGYGAALVLLIVGIAFSLFVANVRDQAPTSQSPWDQPEGPSPFDTAPLA